MTTYYYLYKAELLCQDCGEAKRTSLRLQGLAPDYPSNETTYNSDDFPKGPYADTWDAMDSPAHCGLCGKFIPIGLSSAGVDYVCEALQEYASSGKGDPQTLAAWADFIELSYSLGVQEETAVRLFRVKHYQQLRQSPSKATDLGLFGK